MPSEANSGIVPAFARHGVFVPQEGGKLNIMLPGELVGSLVLKIVGRDVAIIELAVYNDRNGVKKKGAVLGKSHIYQPGDILTCQRTIDEMGVEQWVPVERKHDIDAAERLAAEIASEPSQLAPGATDPPEAAAPEIGSGPAAEPEEPKKVLGPRRSRMKRSEPEPTYRRVLGPRRSKISHSAGGTT